MTHLTSACLRMKSNLSSLKRRKTTRLKGADYNNNGAVFLTICTKDRRCILSRIVGTGLPDGPQGSSMVGTGLSDGPQGSSMVGTGLSDGPKVQLTRYGEIADKYINQINDFYSNLSIESYVIMPNHIHIMLWVKGDECGPSGTPVPTVKDLCGPSGTPVPTVKDLCGPSGTPVPTAQNTIPAKFLSTFKRFCNRECGINIWQYRSYDHIIRNRQDYDEHLRYIYENPMRWYYDELYSEE